MPIFKISKLIFGLLIVYVGICYFRPDLIPSQYNLLPSSAVQSVNQVLGAKDVKGVEATVVKTADFILSLPLVKNITGQVAKKVNQEVEKATEKPKQEIEKVKEDVRQTVCEEWLK